MSVGGGDDTRFIGIDPNHGTGESPTVWVDDSKNELVIQGWKPSPENSKRNARVRVPGHAAGSLTRGSSPDPGPHGAALEKACDAAERCRAR